MNTDRYGVTSTRVRDLSPAARAVHRAILQGFATTGRAPDAQALAAAVPDGHALGALQRELHDYDVVRLDEHGRIRAAYPFSAVPTPHTVAIERGPTVYAMCAVDALGMADMLGRDVVISSTDPSRGDEVTVTIHSGQATWRPVTATVVTGVDCAGDDCCVVPAVDRCCGVMNFFVSANSAESWLADHPRVSGVVLTQEQALRIGVDIFGRLLDD